MGRPVDHLLHYRLNLGVEPEIRATRSRTSVPGKRRIVRQEETMRMSSTFRSLTVRSLALALVMLAMSAASFGQFRVAITVGPPALPVYEQPVCPGDGYLWTPGYWYWDDDVSDYYWVPGTWVMAPEVGFLWTPGWWGWGGEAFLWH